ncbi:two-component system, LytT family, sensor histidine kinase LytS [Lentibacillus halodurans]|uniref:histidine kinase n=1 Tax=Lentibacillus halodurans TaxID=237679 RepID=A0A1I0X1S6_9BACI|nr:LytS/YhcK type 5TM receptor domain-containing protein [Lentibacillus halodurans]SFA94969.1 two-component system, LytT family, sensor histidine kinase LytS [Lentibacillus halodurans]
MKYLTMILFERLGLLLVIAFVLTRIPGFRSLLEREFSKKMTLVHACVFGLFGMAGTITGIVLDGETVTARDFVWIAVGEDQMVVSLSLVAIVIAGLLGGPFVGLGAGIIAGAHLFFLGGIGFIANSLVNPLTGLLAGWTARFFSNERVISPMKALFIGVFPPVLQMHMLLIAEPNSEDMIATVNTIGLPLVLSNSISIAIFTAMIGIALKEQENEAALATKQALTIAEEALPFIKKDSAREMASGIADLLYERLELAAVSVTNEREVLAHRGMGDDHHKEGDLINTSLSHHAIDSRQMQVAYSRSEIQCRHENCPFEATIIIPIMDAHESAGLITFYFRKAHHMRPVELVLAKGLGQLISNQLNTIAAEKLKTHIRDTELRNLQAQINPHFLFNTLHLIAALYRKDPEKARHITVHLAHYMRFNIGLVSTSLIQLEKECQHVKAYIEIIQTRFSSRLTIHFSEPDEIADTFIPPSTIQPLVENSVRHGLKNVIDSGEVIVSMEKTSTNIRIAVRDNGSGFPETILKDAGNTSPNQQNGGAGLYNVNQRLISLLGESARLHIRNLPDSGSEVYFTIPYNDK